MVVTLSLADVACDGESKPPEQTTRTKSPPSADPKPDSGKQGSEDQQPEGTPTDAKKPKPPEPNVFLQPDGTCLKEETFDCPKDPNTTCNPPPPQEVPCPESVLPDPQPKAKVETRADGTCWEMGSAGGCPEGTRCNPPPPRRVKCPA